MRHNARELPGRRRLRTLGRVGLVTTTCAPATLISSVQRALSFLAVGAVLLLGGFFYQRLSAQFDER